MIKLKELIKDQCNCDGGCCSPITEEVMSDRDVKRIKDLTKYNNHTLARYELAKLAKSKQHMKFYQAIMDLQDVIGHLPRGLSLTRHDMEQPFMNLLKRKYKNFEDIYGAL